MSTESALPHRPFAALRSTGLRALVALLVVAGAAAPVLARDDHENDDEGYSIGLWGDLPYSTCRQRRACRI